MASKADLRRQVEDLKLFTHLLEGVLALSTFVSDGWSGRQQLQPKPGREQEWYAAKAAVDRHAARAARAFAESQMHILWKPPGTWDTVPLNPASQWGTIFEEFPRFSLEALEACTNQAIGALEDRIDNPIRGERGPKIEALNPAVRLVWRFAVFLIGGLFLAWLAWKLDWS